MNMHIKLEFQVAVYHLDYTFRNNLSKIGGVSDQRILLEILSFWWYAEKDFLGISAQNTYKQVAQWRPSPSVQII